MLKGLGDSPLRYKISRQLPANFSSEEHIRGLLHGVQESVVPLWSPGAVSSDFAGSSLCVVILCCLDTSLSQTNPLFVGGMSSPSQICREEANSLHEQQSAQTICSSPPQLRLDLEDKAMRSERSSASSEVHQASGVKSSLFREFPSFSRASTCNFAEGLAMNWLYV